MYRSRAPSLFALAYVVVGVLVAAGVIGNDNYFSGINTVGEAVDAVLAVILWPLVLLGVHFHVDIGGGGGGGGK